MCPYPEGPGFRSHACKNSGVTSRPLRADITSGWFCVALTAGLEEALGRTANVTLRAIEAQNAAVHAISVHTQRLKEAMDDSEVGAWGCADS